MATVEQRVKDIQSSWEKERNGVVFVKDGFFGMKDTDGGIIHGAEYAFIGRCRDHILFLRPDGSFRSGCV